MRNGHNVEILSNSYRKIKLQLWYIAAVIYLKVAIILYILILNNWLYMLIVTFW